MSNAAPSATSSTGRATQLARPMRASIATVLLFGLFMQVLLMLGISMAERTLDRGVAPMQELLLIQRHASTALQLVKQQDRLRQADCSLIGQDDLCEVPLLLRNIGASVRRLLDGEGGLSGLPRAHPLAGEARLLALNMREAADRLEASSTGSSRGDPEALLALQRGLLDLSGDAYRLEQALLGQLQKDFRTKYWLNVLAIVTTGLLMVATVVTLFWMWSRVRDSFSQLHASEARLRAYADAVPDLAYVIDEEGRVLEHIGQPQDTLLRPARVPVGAMVRDFRPPALTRDILQAVDRAIRTQQVQTLDLQQPNALGQPRWFEARVAAIAAPETDGLSDGDTAAPVRRVILIARDVTARVQAQQELHALNTVLELRVQERTRELNDAAEELRRFNYTVSHDLRAPLRAVEAYTALAVEEAGATLNEGARDLLERARKSAHQLAQMVESLLNLSRIGEIPLQPSLLDLSAMASEICQAFGVDQKDHQLRWQVAPGLRAWADEHLVRSLLQNLINNAVKYSAKREPALIEVGQARQPDGSSAFFVRDNGAGFDMAHASQLFQPFTRLHPAREFPGDGIGLATVRRIVIRHGGRIWATGQVGAGATFFFTLPTQPPARERDFSGSRPAPLEPGTGT